MRLTTHAVKMVHFANVTPVSGKDGKSCRVYVHLRFGFYVVGSHEACASANLYVSGCENACNVNLQCNISLQLRLD